MREDQSLVLRGQVYSKLDKARSAAKQCAERLARDFKLMGPDDVASELFWLNKHTEDWALWAKVYEEMYGVGGSLTTPAQEVAA